MKTNSTPTNLCNMQSFNFFFNAIDKSLCRDLPICTYLCTEITISDARHITTLHQGEAPCPEDHEV
jgi:hypothetical protein